MLDIIVKSIWNKGRAVANEEDFIEMKKHAIAALPANILSELSLSSDLKSEWQRVIYQQIGYYAYYKHTEQTIPLSVPYVILKGTAAAQYYPTPELRMMGDIDLMTSRDDYIDALDELIKHGYRIISDKDRETVLVKNRILVELHKYFASLNDPKQAKYLDDLILCNINPSHYLPDTINGLVLLEHISQHLENGLGLRQIIDWMMFVGKCLPDEKWPEFQEMAQRIGLERLAIVTTRLCEIYLGLPERSWCAGEDEELCEQFMDYILACGNFGNKQTCDSSIIKNVFSRAKNPRAAFRLLQERGLVNWRTAQKHRFLRPFAWIYQLGRYFSLGIHRDEAMSKLKEEYKEARRRNDMFDKLGVKQTANGLAMYKEGKYVKE